MKIREEKRGERVKRICQSNERRKVHGAKVAQRSEEKKMIALHGEGESLDCLRVTIIRPLTSVARNDRCRLNGAIPR